MYLSTLLVNTGDNPDRPEWNVARRWLRNVYRVHQRLCMAFPSKDRAANDPAYLEPFDPSDFSAGHVHTTRGTHSGFLFRIDPQPGGRVVILVLSALEPDWDYAFGLKPGAVDRQTGQPIGNAGYLLAAPPTPPRPVRLMLDVGSRCRFRLMANPVFRVRAGSVDCRGRCFDERWIGKRVPVASDAESLRNWLERRAAANGFVLEALTVLQPGYVYVNKAREAARGQRLRSVRYEGVLQVEDANRFRAALSAGIGPAKAFGFGLLSVAPPPAMDASREAG